MLQRRQTLFFLGAAILMIIVSFAPLATYGPKYDGANFKTRKQLEKSDPLIVVSASGIDFEMNYEKDIHSSKKEYNTGMTRINEELDREIDGRGIGIIFNVGIIGCLLMVICMGILVFLFKNRKVQIRFGIALFLLTIVVTAGVYIASQVAMRVFAELNLIPMSVAETDLNIGYGYGFFLLPVIAILLLIGVIFVRRDDNLVKSLDRLR